MLTKHAASAQVQKHKNLLLHSHVVDKAKNAVIAEYDEAKL